MRNNRGFSVIELLITLAIVITIACVAVQSLDIFWLKSTKQVLASNLLRAINIARSEAIAKNQDTLVCNSMDEKTCSGLWQNGFIVSVDGQVSYAYRNISAEGKLNWRAYPENRSYLEFASSGLPRGENGTFWFCSEKDNRIEWAIVVSQSGRARMEKPNNHGVILDDQGKVLPC